MRPLPAAPLSPFGFEEIGEEAQGDMAARVFISFAAGDRQAAEAVCAALELRGVGCWMASRDIPAGDSAVEAVVKAIYSAAAMVVVFSAHANASDQMAREVGAAGQRRLAVIPFRIEDVAPNKAFAHELGGRRWIDSFRGWDGALEQLASQIEAAAGGTPTPCSG